jgi:hypothetical protein
MRMPLVGKLLNAAEGLARTRNADFIVLDSSLLAAPFYKSCGFYELETGIAAPAASFSPLFGKTLSHQLPTYPASAQTTIWCKKRAK